MKKSLLYLISVYSLCLLVACSSGSNGKNNGGGGGRSQSAATHFSVTSPATATAGTPFNFTVTALDASNNTVTTYSGTVHFTSTDGQAVLPANSTLTDGTGAFSATLKTSGSETITATDTITLTITGVSNAIEVSNPAPAGTFTITGSMGFPRAGHTATLLQDGTVLISGGENTTGPLASAEIYNSATGIFASTGSMETARVGHTATLLTDGTVLITGGNDATGALATAETFNPSSGTFTPTAGSMETARVGHTATLLNDGTGRVLVAGGGTAPEELFGAGDDGSSALAELFDPKSGQFTPTMNNMLAGRIYHTATLLPNGNVLLAGGTDTAGLSGAALGDLFQPGSATFAATTNQGTTALHFAAPLLQDGMVLLAGGEVSASRCGEGGSLISSAEAILFDNSDANFSQTGDMSASRISHTATLLTGGQVLIAGGAMSHTPCNRGFGTSTFQSIASAELFSPASGTFALTGNMSTERAAHTATLLANGKVLVVGGVNANGNTLASAELFQ